MRRHATSHEQGQLSGDLLDLQGLGFKRGLQVTMGLDLQPDGLTAELAGH